MNQLILIRGSPLSHNKSFVKHIRNPRYDERQTLEKIKLVLVFVDIAHFQLCQQVFNSLSELRLTECFSSALRRFFLCPNT